MKSVKLTILLGALIAPARTPHADARPHLLRRPACQSVPQPTGQYALAAPPVLIHPTAIPPSLFPLDSLQRIAPPSVPVPATPPTAMVVMPAMGSVTLPPSRLTQFVGGAVQRVCGPNGCR